MTKKTEKIDRKIRTWFLPTEKLMEFECEVVLESGTRPRRKVHKIVTKNKEELVIIFKDGFFNLEKEVQSLVCINIYDDEGVFLKSINDSITFFTDDI